MITAAGFIILMLLLRAAGGGGLSIPSILDHATDKQADADKKARKAAQTRSASDQAAAAAAQAEADAARAAAQTAQQATFTPAPWPQKVPAGLPPFPAGWEPDSPPPAAVQARAWQLLKMLWAHGPGTMKTEKTQGRWITYQAQPMGKKKGVVAFRQRGDVLTPPTMLPPNADAQV